MLTALREVESYKMNHATSTGTFVPGELKREVLQEMIGAIKETTSTKLDEGLKINEIETFKEFDGSILTIAPTSNTRAWVGDITSDEIKQLTLQKTEANSITLPSFTDLITLSNGDFIVTDRGNYEIRRIKSAGKEKIIANTKPLRPTCIRETQTDDILVTLVDDENRYELKPSSRRLVQRMTVAGKVVSKFEFREDGTTRLFTFPTRTRENGNYDICVINGTSASSGELIVLHRDGRVRFTYCGEEDSIFGPTDVACDSLRRVLVSDFKNSLYLLSEDGRFLGITQTNLLQNPYTLALYQKHLWVGFNDGTVKVYKYIE